MDIPTVDVCPLVLGRHLDDMNMCVFLQSLFKFFRCLLSCEPKRRLPGAYVRLRKDELYNGMIGTPTQRHR
jgi:hypothetical protein